VRYGDDREVRRYFSVTDMAGLAGLTSKELQRVDDELPQLRATRNRANKRVYLAEHTDALKLVALRLRQGVDFGAIRVETEGLTLEQVRERLGAAGPALMPVPVETPASVLQAAASSVQPTQEVGSPSSAEPSGVALEPETVLGISPAASTVAAVTPMAPGAIARNEEQLRQVLVHVAALRQELMGLLWRLRQP